jgi:hypothetical protein
MDQPGSNHARMQLLEVGLSDFRPWPKVHLPTGGEECGKLWFYRLVLRPSISLAVNIYWDSVPGGGPLCFQTLLSSSSPCGDEKSVKMMWFRRPELRVLNWPSSKYVLRCNLQEWSSVFSDLTQQFTSLLGRGGYRIHIIWWVWAGGLQTHLATNTFSQEASPEDQILCQSQSQCFVFTAILGRWDSLLTREGTASYQPLFTAGAPYSPNFSSGLHQNLSLLTTLLWLPLTQTLWRGIPRLPEPYCSLFLSRQSNLISNNRLSLKLMSYQSPLW